MKKLFSLFIVLTLMACSSAISPYDIARKIPKNTNKTIIFNVNAANNSASNLILAGMMKASSGGINKQLMDLVTNDNLNIGISGKSQMLNKVAATYVIENGKFGKNTKIFMVGDSEQDKKELEQSANTKNIPFEYFLVDK
ncbi:hypothetical protein [Pasteurella canis]|uniref:Lipoprotein n=1 Tax=Pasteurella canis TaxID=753 RepID=A0ABQ4VGD8_9PAST|nr:hypothetical protein [Pasteurella canis]UEC22877.1 hypothetical protein K7G93_001630 [Pasteurella canis]GJH42430.1 hypothetical protein PA42_06040 [Pasteurella canis]